MKIGLKRLMYGVLIITLLFSGAKLGQRFLAQRKSISSFQEAIQVVEEFKEQPENSSFEEALIEPMSPYEMLLDVNDDVVGWIEIEDTSINYPVVQSVKEPDFYLTHGLDKKKSIHGVPYVDARVNLNASTNTIIYAHQMRDGSMFTGLNPYLEKSFYETHPVIRFNTLTTFSEYEIIAVFKTSDIEGEGFPYYNFIQANTAEEFKEFIDQVKALSAYDTRTSVDYGDRLLTLSTCEYTLDQGRLVVVAKQISSQP